MTLRILVVFFVFLGIASKVSAFATDEARSEMKKLSLVAKSHEQVPLKSANDAPQFQAKISLSAFSQIAPLSIALAALMIVFVLIVVTICSYTRPDLPRHLRFKVLFRSIISPNAP